MNEVWFYSILSVFIISLISFIGVLTLSIKAEKLKKILIYFVSFSTGALFAGAFLHLIPEIAEKSGGFDLNIAFLILVGIIIFFIIEKIVCWHHCHVPHNHEKVHSFAIMNLIGDAFHNFLDGLVIAASYLINVPLGIATTIAVIFHEIPQEIGDFGVLLHGGFSKRKALLVNFLTALTAVLGAIVGLVLAGVINGLEFILVPIAAGGFIYIAGSDLVPELHKETNLKKSLIQLIFFLLGIAIMAALLLLE